MKTYELIDLSDNDSHDEGTKAEMMREANTRNEVDGTDRWVVRPEGWAAEHFTGEAIY